MNYDRGFLDGSEVKNSPASAETAGDVGLMPESGRSPGERNGNPLQYSCLGNLTEEHGRQQFMVLQRVAESDTTEATLHAAPKEYQRLWKLKQHTHVRKHKGTGKG